MDSSLSQWVIDLIGIISMFLVWLPFVVGLVTLLILLVINEIKVSKAKTDYYTSLSEHDKQIIDGFRKCERVWLFRGKRHIIFKK